MVGIVAVLVVVTLSVVATRVGAAALEATGVSTDLAHFQARSAFTGVGYTTREAETVADHPARRRIVLTLMLLGNAGIVSVIASLVIGLGNAPTPDVLGRIGILVVGLGALWALSSTPWFNQAVKRAIHRLLGRWTDLEVRDYVQLLYGREASLDELGYRPHGPVGDAEHEQGVTRHGHATAVEQARDRQAEAERGTSSA